MHLHVHVSDQTVRDGRGVVRTPHGPLTVDQLRHFLGDTCPNIKVYPVYDPADTAAVDNYEIPIALRRSQSIKNPASVFPFSPATSRMDLDHTAAYEPDGPPGQTSMANLGPLTRSEHRAKTVGGWRAKQPDPGLYVWRSPEGQIVITTNQGTLVLGGTAFAHQIWRFGRQGAEGCAVVRSTSASRALADCVRHGGAEPEGCRDDSLPALPRVSATSDRLIAWHRELTAAHARLRSALQLAQDSLDDPQTDPRVASRDLLLYCLGFCAALGGHHRSEDAGLFPELAGRHPELDETIAYLKQDHSMIAYLLSGLEKAIRSQAPPEEIGRHLEGLAAIMESHFRYEERQLLTVLATLDLDAAVPDMLGPL